MYLCICICCWCSGISAERRRPPGSWRRWQSSSPRWEYKGVPVHPLIHKRTAVDTFSLHWGLPLCQISFFSDWNASPNKLFLLYTVLVGFAKYRRYLPRGIYGKNPVLRSQNYLCSAPCPHFSLISASALAIYCHLKLFYITVVPYQWR